MNRGSRYIILLMLCLLPLTAIRVVGQTRYRLTTFEDFNNETSKVSRIVRDGQGMIWFSTNDGLFRYDGYEFRNFKSHSGDGINMSSNRITSMYPSSDGSIWCVVGGRVFLFDMQSYRYIDVMADYERQHGKTYHISKLRPLPCGTTWLFTDDGLMFALQDARPTRSIQLMATHEPTDGLTVMCDSKQRSWVLTSQHTYLHHDNVFKRFDQTFWRVISTEQFTWLVSDDGKLWMYDERAGQPRPWNHPLLTAPVKGYSTLNDKNIVLCTEAGLLKLSPDGKKLETTAVTWKVSKVVQDKHGNVWLLGSDGRLSMADRQLQHIVNIEGVRMNDLNIHADKYGTLWFFADNGDVYYAYADNPARLYPYNNGEAIGNINNTIYDEQGGIWFLRNGVVCRLAFESQRFRQLPLHHPDQVRSLIIDRQQRLLVTTRNEADISVFSRTGDPLGWIGRNGIIGTSWQPFGAAVYSSFIDSDGTLWLGTKKDGVFRLRLQQDGNYQVDQFRHDDKDPYSLSDNEVYDFAADADGRLWVATRHGGLCCVADPKASTLRFTHAANDLKGWTAGRDVGVSSLLLLPSGLLLVGTYDGLYIGDAREKDFKKMAFKKHQREASRKESISSSAIADLIQVSDGRIFITTEDGGVNEILTQDLTSDRLDFLHYDLSTGFPTDITRMMIQAKGSLWVTTPNRLVEMRLGQSQHPDINTFLMKENPHFSVAAPVPMDSTRWAFGTEEGVMIIDLNQLKTSSFTPPIVVTGVSKEGSSIDYAEGRNDTIRLSSHERDLTIWFAALDYEDTRHVVYAYRMGEDGDRPWTYLGHNHSIAMSQMKPGTYYVNIRSTNSDGVWCDNQRTLVIIVKPAFWETTWALLLMVLMISALAAAVAYTVHYIRKLKRQRHEMLEKYLALLEKSEPAKEPKPIRVSEAPAIDKTDDALMQRLVGFVEDNLGNSDISIDDMAQACAVSRTGLHRKVKVLLGTTPMEFMREARIRKSAQLLVNTSKPVSVIAYECGFADPKYFSKCFKATTGMTPSEYKTRGEK
ncbi:MAG: helix-turn-helix domain-containing protein [Prevotella sp.]|nr:helix-turn-helix domain-containing protein [Prevotella sp.]